MSIIINSKFKPFSYAELLQPLQQATEVQVGLENAYAELNAKASVWEKVASEQVGSKAYNMYKGFSDDLKKQADLLATNGLTPSSRQALGNMFGRYSKEIIPIEQAYNKKMELVKEQRDLLNRDNSMMFDINAANLNLDSLISNPHLTYKSLSGEQLRVNVANDVKNLAKEIRDNPRKWRSILNNSYFETMMQRGATAEEVLLASLGDENSPKFLREAVERAIDASGVKNWNNEDILNRAYDYAKRGLSEAIGNTEYQMAEDWRAKLATQHAYQRALQPSPELPRANLPINTHNLVSKHQQGEKAKKSAIEMRDNLGLYKDKPEGNFGRNIKRKFYATSFDFDTKTNDRKEATYQETWFNSKGQLLSKRAYIDNAMKTTNLSAESKGFLRNELSRRYDKMSNYIRANIEPRDGYYYSKDIINGINNIERGSGAFSMSAIGINFGGDNNKKVLEGIMPLLEDKEGKVSLKRISEFDAKGNIKSDEELIDKSFFYDDKDNIESTPYFFASPNANVNGLIMGYKGDYYLIPKDKLGSILNETYTIDIPKLKKAVSMKQELINTYGEDAYYNSSEGKNIETIIEQSGGAFYRTAVNSLGATVKAGVWNTKLQGENEIP